MDKLTLNLDDLTVSSFTTDADETTPSGTVRGQAAMIGTYNGCDTRELNCGNSCGLYYCDSNDSCGGGLTTIAKPEIEDGFDTTVVDD